MKTMMKTFDQIVHEQYESTTDNHLMLWQYNELKETYYPIKPTDALYHEEDGEWQIGIKNETPFDGAEYVEHEKLYLKYFNYAPPTAETNTTTPNASEWLKHMLCCIPDETLLEAMYDALKLKGMAIKMAEKLKEDGLMEIYDHDVIEHIRNNDVDMRWRDIQSLIEHNNCEDKCAEEYVNGIVVENYLDSNSIDLSWSTVKDIISNNGFEDEVIEEYGGNIEDMFESKSSSEKREILCSLINNL